jgi:peptide/nickel transport system ATP-binding protein
VTIFEVTDLSVAFGRKRHLREVVSGVSFSVSAGETLAVVGESGSGKSLSLLGATGLLPRGAHVRGSARFCNTQLIGAPAETLRRLRGADIGFVFQDPLSNLHPLKTIGNQLAEAITTHRPLRGASLRARLVALLDEVGIREGARRLHDYPHQFSGGMRQRVMVAMAIALNPGLIIADEPTTALDVTVQAGILRLLKRLQETHGTALIFVSHDLGVVSDIADRVAVMRAGKVVETATATTLYTSPSHSYTQALLDAARHGGGDGREGITLPAAAVPRVAATGLVRHFRDAAGGRRTVLQDISFTIGAGEILGLVGESGSGKSTIGRILAGLDLPDEGSVSLDHVVYATPGRGRPHLSPLLRRQIQVVFQDPYSSLNPHRRVEAILAEPLIIRGGLTRDVIAARVAAAAARVHLPKALLGRLPAQLSGGQRQRVAIARALMLDPTVIIADEPVSALDVTTQRQIVALFAELRTSLGLSILFISHDLGIVADLCDRVLVLEGGHIVEAGETAAVFRAPAAAYTRALLAAIPGRGRLFPVAVAVEPSHV